MLNTSIYEKLENYPDSWKCSSFNNKCDLATAHKRLGAPQVTPL